ncbi:MAG TPA: extracellular solute-binding protein [Firmicutes bacterium]|nr:extracellular solute-binding protein [Bacillota bacterium]
MRKLTCLTVLLLTVAMLFAVNVQAEKVKLLWTTCCGQADRAVLFQKIAQDYMALHPDVEIEWRNPAGDYTANMVTYFATNTAPDVFWIGAAIWNFIDMVLPLNDFVEKDAGAQAINPAVRALAAYQGKQIGLPYGANVNTIMYNKDHFSQAGLNPPTASWTWDDLIQMARQLTVDTNGDGKIDRGGAQFVHHQYWMLTAGGDFYTPDLRRVQIANAANAFMVQMQADMSSGILPIMFQPYNSNAGIEGLAAMTNIGIFDLPKYQQAPFSWDIQKFPTLVVDGQRYENTYVTLEQWAISRQTKHPDVALDFLSFLLSREAMTQITESRIVIPTQNIMASRFIQQPPPPENYLAFMEGLNHGHQIILGHPYGTTLYNWARQQPLWNNMWSGAIPARTALQELQDTLNKQLDQYWASVN